MVNDQNPRTGFERGEQVADDVACFVVGPVVQNKAEDVDVCDCGLRVEEVMFFEGYGVVVPWWEEGGGGGHDAGLVLDCGCYVWVSVYYCHAEVAFVAADLCLFQYMR